jgi:hypothetical protein
VLTTEPHRFNTGPDTKETAIITSVGEYVIAWDFSKVKKGKLDSYQIKKWAFQHVFILSFDIKNHRYTGNVVEDNFSFGNDKEIVCLSLYDTIGCLPMFRLSPYKMMF